MVNTEKILKEVELIKRANHLIENNHGILYRSSIGILKTGLKRAEELHDFADLYEYVPKYEVEYKKMKLQFEENKREEEAKKHQRINILFKSYTKEMLYKELDKCEKESLKLMGKWSELHRDERTQRKATISNRAEANAQRMMLIRDAITHMKRSELTRI